jgi:hypothetical protein
VLIHGVGPEDPAGRESDGYEPYWANHDFVGPVGFVVVPRYSMTGCFATGCFAAGSLKLAANLHGKNGFQNSIKKDGVGLRFLKKVVHSINFEAKKMKGLVLIKGFLKNLFDKIKVDPFSY